MIDLKQYGYSETEPGCAVLAALDDGSLSSEHWERYLAQKRENNRKKVEASENEPI